MHTVSEDEDEDEGSGSDIPANASGDHEAAKAIEDEFLDEPQSTPAHAIGSIHVLPFTASESSRYGPCRLVSYQPGSSDTRREVTLQWISEIRWKAGEKRSKPIGTVNASDRESLKFTLKIKTFEKLRAAPNSICKGTVSRLSNCCGTSLMIPVHLSFVLSTIQPTSSAALVSPTRPSAPT